MADMSARALTTIAIALALLATVCPGRSAAGAEEPKGT